MNAIWEVNREDYLGFCRGLEKDHAGQTQFRNGYKQRINHFCLAYIDGETLFGRISGPNGKHMMFSVALEDGAEHPSIEIEPEAMTKGYTFVAAYADIVKALGVMMARVKKGRTGRIGTKFWDGLYLINLKGRKVSKDGKATLAGAVNEDIISPDFAETCVDRGFTMSDRRKSAS